MTVMSADSTAVQSQKAVSAYFTSKQILPFGFAEQVSPGTAYCVILWAVILILRKGSVHDDACQNKMEQR